MSAEPPPEADTVAIASLDAGTASAPGYEPLARVIQRRLRDAILDGSLAPGARIRQEVVARHLGTSRIPVREALKQLEREGLVVLVPHSGARVARLDFTELIEMYKIREALEPAVIEQSAPNLTDAQLQELAAVVDQIDGVELAGEGLGKVLVLDRRFHLLSYAAAPMPRSLAMIEGFWNVTHHYRRAYYGTLGERELEVVTADHRLILDALCRRDGADAADRQRSHIRGTRLRLMEHVEVFDV